MRIGWFCRLWPLAHDFEPKDLKHLSTATVGHMIRRNNEVLWVPGSDSKEGSWVSAHDACFLQDDYDVPECVVNTARRAGLLIPTPEQTAVKVSVNPAPDLRSTMKRRQVLYVYAAYALQGGCCSPAQTQF